jgi:hypothetical protein
MIKIVYKEEIYTLGKNDTAYCSNFLLFLRQGSKRTAYTVQMAVNYIKKIPEASFDQSFEEQDFVACLPIIDYPEVLKYIENGCKPLNILELADTLAKQLVVDLGNLLNERGSTGVKLVEKTEKLYQYKKLLEVEGQELPQSIYNFEELYHSYLNRQRVMKYSLEHRLKSRALITDIQHYILNSNGYIRTEIIEEKLKNLTVFKKSIEWYKYSWLENLEKDIEKFKQQYNV